MNVIYLNQDIILKISREPSLYEKFPFLNPMKTSALRVHKQIAEMGCSGCAKGAKTRAATFIAGAFMNLVRQEAAVQPNSLGALKLTIGTILNSRVDEVRMAWTLGNQSGEIKF